MSRQQPLDTSQARLVTEILGELSNIKRTGTGPTTLLACLLHDLVSYTATHGMQQDAYLFALAVSCSLRGIQEEASEALVEELHVDALFDATAEPLGPLNGISFTGIDPSRN